MTAKVKNSNLAAAKKTKNDEFYTQWPDIEREMNAYLEYDPDVFRGLNSTHKCNAHPCMHFVRRLPAQALARA